MQMPTKEWNVVWFGAAVPLLLVGTSLVIRFATTYESRKESIQMTIATALSTLAAAVWLFTLYVMVLNETAPGAVVKHHPSVAVLSLFSLTFAVLAIIVVRRGYYATRSPLLLRWVILANALLLTAASMLLVANPH